MQKEILDQLDKLSPEQQREVLHFARALATTAPALIMPAGKPGKELLSFAGTIEAEDLRVMSQAIEEDCERVNSDEW